MQNFKAQSGYATDGQRLMAAIRHFESMLQRMISMVGEGSFNRNEAPPQRQGQDYQEVPKGQGQDLARDKAQDKAMLERLVKGDKEPPLDPEKAKIKRLMERMDAVFEDERLATLEAAVALLTDAVKRKASKLATDGQHHKNNKLATDKAVVKVGSLAGRGVFFDTPTHEVMA